MAVIQRREGKRGHSWRVLVRVAGHPPVSKTFPAYDAARKYAAGIESKVRHGERVSGDDRVLFGAVLDRYLEGTRSGRLKRLAVAAIKVELGDIRLRQLSNALP